jgi:hypothetical protein
MDNVLFNYVVNGVVIESLVPYRQVLARTGLTDTVGLTELGWIEHIPVPAEPEITKAQLDMGIRSLRAHLLQESDWTQVADSPLTAAKKAEWATYRQQLRDMPQTFAAATTIAEIVVPQAPT